MDSMLIGRNNRELIMNIFVYGNEKASVIVDLMILENEIDICMRKRPTWFGSWCKEGDHLHG